MCIIIAKPRGKALPDESVFKECFDHNPDGAGMMYLKSKDGTEFTKSKPSIVRIEKGHMDFESYWDAIYQNVQDGFITEENPAVFHCRIRTTGETIPANTHPFPVSSKIADLRALKFNADLGVVHNGIISIKTAHGNSDTQAFVKNFLSKYIIEIMLQDKDTHEAIKQMGGISKFCFLTTERMTMLGSGWVEDGGIFYSNSSYKKRATYFPSQNRDTSAACYNHTPFVFDKELKEELGNCIQDFWDFFTLFDMDWDRALHAVYDKYRLRLKTPYKPYKASGYGS